MAPGPSARWYRPRQRPRGRSGSASATAAAAVAGGDCGAAAGDCSCGGDAAAAASARTAGGGAPPTSAGAGGAAVAAVAAAGRGRSSWGSRRGRCPCPEGTWRADPWSRGGLRSSQESAGGSGIEGELADRIGKMIWEAESRSLALGSGANSNPFFAPPGGFVGGEGARAEIGRAHV